jgi:hypothetical protein
MPGPARDGAAIATANVRGQTRVIARGRIRHHRLTLTLKHVHPGRYRLTLLELSHGRRVVIGHTTLTVT